MDKATKHKVDEHILRLLDYLDGRGIVCENEGLVKKALKDFGDYKVLRDILGAP